MRFRVVVIACAGMLQACAGPESAFVVRLPLGDGEEGRKAFESLQCSACHDVRGDVSAFEAPVQIEIAPDSEIDVRVTLGGEASRVKTYGELVTAIINPSHELAPGYREEDVSVDGESLMASKHINQVMTVEELIDIVAYLQPLYDVKPPKYDPYTYTDR